ncbi:MAG: hypothetical protein V4721_10515 [Bacteroidota bacterium]
MTATSKQLTTKDSAEAFLALKKSSMEIAAACDKISITDDTSLQLATQNLRNLNSTIGQIEIIRVAEKKPYKEAGEQIDALAKELSKPLALSLDAGKKKILKYNNDKLAAANAEQNRINGIKSEISKYSADAMKAFNECKTIEDLTAKRDDLIKNYFAPGTWAEFDADYQNVRVVLNDYCKQRRIEIQTPAQVDETASEAIKEALEEKVAEVGIQEVANAEFTTTTKFRGLPRYRIIDEAAIPREWLMVDDAKVKAYQKENKETLSNGEVVTGIEFYIEENVKI